MTSEISSSDTPSSNANLQLAYQRLLALERFKSGFLARTSHELRSPINTIVSLSQLILEDLCEGPEEEKEFIAQSKEAALKMLALFDQITAVSKLDIGREPPKVETVDLSFLLPEVEMLTTLQAANQNIRYTVTSPTTELEISTDAKWLKNILVYLVQDAIPKTKFLTTTVNQTEQSIMIAIESDRTQSSLQADLDTISDIDSLPSASNTASETASDHLALSTGLILATAQTALPLINGTFSIEKSPTAEGSQLQLTFPKQCRSK